MQVTEPYKIPVAKMAMSPSFRDHGIWSFQSIGAGRSKMMISVGMLKPPIAISILMSEIHLLPGFMRSLKFHTAAGGVHWKMVARARLRQYPTTMADTAKTARRKATLTPNSRW